MDLDNNLKNKIESLLEGYPLKQLKEISFSIIDSYHRLDKEKPVVDDDLKAKIYAVTRMPATFKAMDEVLNHISIEDEYKTALDLGAGLGAASLALSLHGKINSFDLFEKEEAMRKLGAYLLNDKRFSYHEFDVTRDNIDSKYDIVIASYMLNELKQEERKEVFEKVFKAINHKLVIIEPGTPQGYKIILEARNFFLSKGMRIEAPCPHENECPMKKDDWCHFATRVRRSKMHRLLKEGDAPYEDEKYSYIVFAKDEVNRCNARVIRHPIINKGMIKLTACTSEGIKEVTIRKKDCLYKTIKNIKVGDTF